MKVLATAAAVAAIGLLGACSSPHTLSRYVEPEETTPAVAAIAIACQDEARAAEDRDHASDGHIMLPGTRVTTSGVRMLNHAYNDAFDACLEEHGVI